MTAKRIYFMRPVGEVGPIKIGCSKLPELRLEHLSIVSPLRLEIVATCPGSHPLERRLHSMFAKHWLHHEWFGASKELLALVDYVAANGALPDLPEGKVIPLPRTRQQRNGYRAAAKKVTTRTRAKQAEIGRAAKPDYESGLTMAEVAAKHGCHQVTLRRCLVEAGVAIRRYTVTHPHGVRDQERADEFKRRRLAGETLKQIGDAHGVTRERVRQILKKLAA